MPDDRTAAACSSGQPDPQQDRSSESLPPFIAQVLYVIAVVAQYGHHILDMLEDRTVLRGFVLFARFFGTMAVPVISAHVRRGIMRAVALDRMLRARAARGLDLQIPVPRTRGRRQSNPVAAAAGSRSDAASSVPTAATRPTRHTGPNEPLTIDTLPTMKQLEAEVRRRTIGSTVADICRDLGISSMLCESVFHQRISWVIGAFGGNFDRFVKEINRREKRFRRQLREECPNLDRLEVSKEAFRRTVGFVIGESLANLFNRATDATPAAAAAGPAMWGAATAVAATGPP
ncbi:MAG TPA: hypothetical protein VMU81_17945 [Acetobacteraceae bacterium]|nr:hypothetical protein [Acetobacteraceae bacterium]